MTRRPALALAALLTLVVTATGCTGSDEPTPAAPSPTKNVAPTELSLGVWGTEEELVAWDQVVREYNEASTTTKVSLVEWSSHDSARRQIETGEIPDVFMVERDDLSVLEELELSQPVSELLDERGVDFGDRFSRDAVEALSRKGELQCMPWSISPQVLFVNEKLVDFEAMEVQGLDTPNRWDRWTLAEFQAAAEFASRPAKGTVGVHIEPSIAGLAPFVLSAGGSIFDDAAEPTRLDFSSDETHDALEQTLAVLRNASLTLSDEQLEKRSPLEWFKRGKLGIVAGDRSLVPELRAVENLDFNVMAMPRLEDAATVGEVTGLCISSKAKAAAAANLIAHVSQDEPTAQLVRTGGVQPANLAVASSDDFLQTDQLPHRSRVFNTVVRGMAFPPLTVSWAELEGSVDDLMQQLLSDPGEIDLRDLSAQIDEASKTVLSPEEASPTADPTASSTTSPSASPKG